MGSHCNIELPNDPKYIGTRAIIFNNCFIYTRSGDWTTHLTVQGGSYIYGTLTMEEMASIDIMPPKEISFASYIFELIGIPEPHNFTEGTKCGWLITNYNKEVCYIL